MLSIPSELLTKFVQQGIEKGLLSNVQRTLDGESFLHESFIDKVIVKETQNKGSTLSIKHVKETTRLSHI
jgi:hypothetical protein